MPDVSFASFSTVIGVLSGIVALLGALYAFAVYRDHLPSARLRHLEELLKEVEDLYKSGIESQLIPSQGFRDEVQNKLTRLRGATYRHRQRAHCAVNLRQQWAEFFRGLSFAIHQTCTEVKILRAEITTATENERYRLLSRLSDAPTLIPSDTSSKDNSFSPSSEDSSSSSSPSHADGPATPTIIQGSIAQADEERSQEHPSDVRGDPPAQPIPKDIVSSGMASGVKSMQHDGLRARKPSLAHLPESAHHAAFVQFLTGMAHSGLDPNYRTVARGKLSRLSTNQFSELTDDVHDELERRTMKESDPLSSPPDYHPKRAAARAKLCTLPDHRFGDLVGDVLHDLRSRYPDVVGVLMFHLP